MTLAEMMWKNQPGRLQRARAQARMARKQGNLVSAHSIMLSAYYTILGGQPVEGYHPVRYGIPAMWHAWCLFLSRNKMSHTQLDVWFQFMLRLRAKLGFKSGRILFVRWYPQLDLLLLDGADREINLAIQAKAKPHQLALAYLTLAEVRYTVDFCKTSVVTAIDNALALKTAIEKEGGDDEDAVRYAKLQLIRIYKKIGELYSRPALRDVLKSVFYLTKAIELARELDAEDQILKITPILERISAEEK